MTDQSKKTRKRFLTSNDHSQSIRQRKIEKEKEKERSKEKEKEKDNKEILTTLKKELKFFPSRSAQKPRRRKLLVPKEKQSSLYLLKNSTPEIINDPPKPKPKVFVPSTIESLLTIWYDYKLSKHKSRDTFRFKEDVKFLRKLKAGTLFKDTEHENRENPRFTKAEFEQAVESFSLMANHSSYWPKDKSNLKRTPISVFLYNFRGKRITSWFLWCLDNTPNILNDKGGNTKLAQEMMSLYVRRIGDGFIFDLTPKQIDHFVEGSKLADNIFNSNPKIPKELIDTDQKKALLIFESLRSYANGKYMETRWFANPLTYNKTLIEHLKVKIHDNVIPLMSIYQYR